MIRKPAADPGLWHSVQLIVYPRKPPSFGAPFPAEICSPKRKPASWLYHTLAADPALRAKVLP